MAASDVEADWFFMEEPQLILDFGAGVHPRRFFVKSAQATEKEGDERMNLVKNAKERQRRKEGDGVLCCGWLASFTWHVSTIS